MLRSTLALLLLASFVYGGEIKGDRKVQPNKLIKLESDIAPKLKDGKQTTRYSWRVVATNSAKQLVEIDSYKSNTGQTYIAVAPAGTVVQVTVTVIDFQSELFDEATAVVIVEGTEPTPSPTPTPVPTPLPDGEFGLIKASRDGMSKVTSTTKADQAKRLAQAHRTHSSSVAAGTFNTVEDILDGWRTSNRKVFSADEQTAWRPWADAVKAKLDELVKAKKLNSNNDWSDAFREIAQGLSPAR